MVFSGTYQSYDKDNDSCVILSDDRFITCTGLVPKLRKNTPVLCSSSVNDDTGEYSINSIRFSFLDKAAFIRFFSGPVFRGIGKKNTEAIYEKLLFEYECLIKNKKNNNIDYIDIINTDISNIDDISDTCIDFTDIEENITRKILSEEDVPDATAFIFINEMYGLKKRMNVFSEIKPFGGTYREAGILYEKYGDDAIDKLHEEPYEVVRYGVSFHLSDIYSYNNGGSYLSPERFHAMQLTLSRKLCSDGSTCTEIKKTLRMAGHIFKAGAPKFSFVPEECILASLISSRMFTVKQFSDGLFFYPNRYYYIEELLSKEIGRLQDSAKETGYPGCDDDSFLDDDQKKAMNVLKTGGVKIITGGPGAGKTTLIKKIISSYKKLFPDSPYFLSAPTGRAAVRIQESSGHSAVTIHKLLGVRPYSADGELSLKYTKEHQLPKGLFIIDEMSMVGEELFSKLLSAIPDGSIVILSGDPRQLQSVDPGNVLYDLIQSGVIEQYSLTKIHRQGNNSAILKNYYSIRDYNYPDIVSDDSFSAYKAADYDDAIKMAEKIEAKYNAPDDPYSCQILSFTKKGVLGKNRINHDFVVKKKERGNNVYFGRSSYSPGDKIMMTKNNYKKGYWNGDVGVITNVSGESIEAKFYDGIRTIGKDSLRDMDHACACTVHKAQGSEYDTVIVIIDDECRSMLYNSIILTAITRAKKRVFIISVGDGFRHAVINNRSLVRTTGLADLVKERMSYAV